MLYETKLQELENFYDISTQKHIGTSLNKKSLKQYENEFNDNRFIYLSVMKDDRLAGYIILTLESGRDLQLRRIVIDEKYLGIGSEVLHEIEKYTLDVLKKHYIWLDVYADNIRAINLYERMGYMCFKKGVEIGKEVLYYEKACQK